MGLIICGVDHDINANIRNYRETGWDATIENCVQAGSISTQCNGLPTPFGEKAKGRKATRYSMRHALRQYGRDPNRIPLAAAQAAIKQFVIHHDGLARSDQCFHVLQNERGLSCHFLIDNDGTIYQTLDLALCGFHASEYNPISIGVEMANRGDWEKTGEDGHYYTKRYPNLPADHRHEEAWCVIGHSKIHCYDFTKAQVSSLGDLAKALAKLLPGIALDYPQDVPGHCSNTVLQPNAFGFSGYIGHYHLTNRKWDPGPFDFKKFIDGLRGSLCFPVWTGKVEQKREDKPAIPESIDELDARTKALYSMNEDKSDGGYFPVGPWGDARLWHGGVHIPQFGAGAPAPVWAPFPGRIVAARMGRDSSIGSQNFVLLKHEMSVGPQKMRFFSLYMHLLDEMAQGDQQPAWMGKESWKKNGKKGEAVPLDEPIEAGEVIGRFGTAGPADLSKKQIHFEIFATKPVHTDEDSKWWTVYDGSATGRFCEIPDIIQPIDTKTTDGILEHEELTDFFSGSGDRQSFRKFVVLCTSEWTDRPDWTESLLGPPDFPDDEVAALVDDQIKPGLWWTEALAKELHLPPDGTVYHYHPLTFIQWINEKILEAQANPTVEEPTSSGTGDMTADFESESNDDSDMFNETVANSGDPFNDLIDLPHLLEGYEGEPEVDL
jgi:N-acetyl-anhydromuramyl-L-alanine amidase AmpD